jgi:hypothetical protein
LRLGEVVAVAIPSVEQEAAGDLVRAREDCRADLDDAAPAVELLLRQGIVYYGRKAWTGNTNCGYEPTGSKWQGCNWPMTPPSMPCWPPWTAGNVSMR